MSARGGLGSLVQLLAELRGRRGGAAGHNVNRMTVDPPSEPQRGVQAASTADPAGQSSRAREMLDLSREECLRLLAGHSVGRLAVIMSESAGAHIPVIRPVNYVFDERSKSVVFRTARGSKFHALLRSAHAAFEVDGVDEGLRTGWSVIISGVTEEITQPFDVRRLESLGLETWAPGPRPHWVRIRAGTVSGRRIVLAADRVPGYPA